MAVILFKGNEVNRIKFRLETLLQSGIVGHYLFVQSIRMQHAPLLDVTYVSCADDLDLIEELVRQTSFVKLGVPVNVGKGIYSFQANPSICSGGDFIKELESKSDGVDD